MTDAPLDLDAIRSRTDAASPGPWTVADNGSIFHSGPSESLINEHWGSYVVASCSAHDISRPGQANAEFIAHAREDIPALIAEVARLTRQLHDAHLTIRAFVGDKPTKRGREFEDGPVHYAGDGCRDHV